MRTYNRLVFATAMFTPIMLATATIMSEAADASRPPAYPIPPPPLFYKWTGVYAGVHAGAGFNCDLSDLVSWQPAVRRNSLRS